MITPDAAPGRPAVRLLGMRRLYVLLALLTGSGLISEASQLAMAPKAQHTPALTIRDIGPGEVAIDGDWQFHLGDDMRWAAPAYDDSQWEHIKADDTWGAQTHPGYTGVAWYRRYVDLPPSLSGKQKLAILMPPVDDAYEIYWNGEKIGNQGTLPPDAVWYYGHRQSFALPDSPSGSPNGLVAVRVWKSPLNSSDLNTSGGLNAPPIAGDAAVISAKVAEGDFQRLRGGLYGRAISVLFLLIGTVSFIGWIRNRQQRLFLWFALWLFGKIALYYLSSDRVIELISGTTFSCLLMVLHSIVDCSVFLMLLYLFNLQDNPRLRRWTWIAIGLNVGFGLAEVVVLLFWENARLSMQLSDAAFTVAFMVTELFVLVLVYQGMKSKPDLSRKLVAVMAFLFTCMNLCELAQSREGVSHTGPSTRD